MRDHDVRIALARHFDRRSAADGDDVFDLEPQCSAAVFAFQFHAEFDLGIGHGGSCGFHRVENARFQEIPLRVNVGRQSDLDFRGGVGLQDDARNRPQATQRLLEFGVLNLLPLPRDAAAIAAKDPREAAYRSELELFLREETGYQWIQGTRPQTLAYGLTDSPVGLAAWIGEKFHGWSDHDGDVFAVIPIDRVLTNIMIYWGTGAIGSSFWPYYARLHGPWPIPERGCLGVPAGYAAFPKEILRPPRSLAERIYDIRRWTTMPRGGHFAALEQPDLLATDVRAFFRPLRT